MLHHYSIGRISAQYFKYSHKYVSIVLLLFLYWQKEIDFSTRHKWKKAFSFQGGENWYKTYFNVKRASFFWAKKNIYSHKFTFHSADEWEIHEIICVRSNVIQHFWNSPSRTISHNFLSINNSTGYAFMNSLLPFIFSAKTRWDCWISAAEYHSTYYLTSVPYCSVRYSVENKDL